ncbi:MAG: hypothetical protein RIQ41_186 [Candidatus Parcubacteria bacterium]|jgi:ubiquinone/menaquinone biosynthesis C-methylase UbiE
MGESPLSHNIRVHNKIAKQYEKIHGEIYNTHEQVRLKSALLQALQEVRTNSSHLTVLDFGCGAGNLTQHLTDAGASVIAADVSQGFLDLVASRTYAQEVRTFLVNGVDLAGIQDGSVDMVAMYSVLHHVPDYLSLMKEFARVLKNGGVLYIDHEASASSWTGALDAYRADMKRASAFDISKYLHITNYIDRIIRMFFNPRYQREGDIHVFPDDHIDWQSIREELAKYDVTAVSERDYLLSRRNDNKAVFDSWKDKVGDMHLYIGRKSL